METPLRELIFLNDTLSTDPSAAVFLEPGDWKFSVAGTASDGYSIGIQDSRRNANDWRHVSAGGAPVALIEVDPSKIIRSGGEDYRCTRSTGVANVTVVATQIPSVIRQP